MIDYKKLSELVLQFNIDEKDFATQVLEIEKYNFDNIKHDENRRTRIMLKAKFNKDKTKAAGQVDKRKQKYNEINNINDYAQDTMVYIIEHCGDLERNFKDNIDLCKALIYKRAEAFIKGKILFGKKRRTISIDSYYTDRKDNSLIINDKTQDTERKAISALEKNYTESDLLTRVLEYINYGKTPIEAINLVADQNNIDMEELTQSIKEIYSKRSRVKAEEER